MISRPFRAFIRIKNNGLRDYYDTATRRCIEVCNIICAWTIVVCILMQASLSSIGFISLWPIAVGMIFSCLLSLELNNRGLHLMGRVFITTAAFIATTAAVLMAGYHSQFSLFYLAVLAIIPILFSVKESQFIWGFLGLYALAFCVSPFAPKTSMPTEVLQQFMPVQHAAVASLAVVAAMYFMRVNSAHYSEIEAHRFKLLQSSRSEALKEVSAGVSHEINNPLAIIQGRVDQSLILIKDLGPAGDVIERNLVSVGMMVLRISKIVRALQQLSEGSDRDPFEPVPLKQILSSAVNLSSDRFQAAGIEFRILDNIPGLKFECRMMEISQILMSLLTNAYEAVRFVPGERWVRLETLDQGDSFSIQITDSGSGIPKEFHERIMEPFFSTKASQGAGLGLTIARALAQGHHGRLYLNTNSEHTLFVLILPKKQNAVPKLFAA